VIGRRRVTAACTFSSLQIEEDRTKIGPEEHVRRSARNATLDTEPEVLVVDRDAKAGTSVSRVCQSRSARKVVRTAVRTPNMNAFAERFVGTLRRELLDHVLVLGEAHLCASSRSSSASNNQARPHQGRSAGPALPRTPEASGRVVAIPVLNGLHHDYRRAV